MYCNGAEVRIKSLAITIREQPANQIRMLQSNFASLGRTIGSLFIPILQTVLPYINAIVIALQRMFAYIAKLLGIKLSNYVASTGGIAVDTSNIADEMDNASDSIDTANKNAKKLEKTLSVLAFDELNQLSDNSDSGGTSSPASGTGGSAAHLPALDAALDAALANYQKAWDEAFKKMSNRANEMADAIVNAFKKKDWKGLGKIMADGINWGMKKLYDAINWNKVGPAITKFTSAFTQTFNSLVDNINWDLIGRTFGAGINTIVNTANQLLEGIDWKNLGAKFASGVSGLVREVDWENLGNLIGNSFMRGWKIFAGFVENLPYSEIGVAVANGLNGIFRKINFAEIADALATGLNGAFNTLASFTKTFDWDEMVDNITGGIVTFMQKFDWKGNGAKLEDFINHLLTALVDIAKGVDWEAFGHNVGVFLSEIDWGKHLKQLLTVLTSVLGGIWEGLGSTSAGTFIQAIAVFAIGSKLMPFVNSITKFLTGSTVTTKLSTAIQGMLNPAITSVAETAVPALGTSLGSLVATGGGIALATAGAVFLTKKIAGLFETIQKQADTYMSSVDTTTSMHWGNSSREATLKAREMKVAVSTELGFMDKSVASHFKSQYNIAYGKWESLGKAVSSYISKDMNRKIGRSLNSVVNTIKSKFTGLYNVGRNAMQELANGMRSVHISTPHMWMNMNASTSGNHYSYNWNSGVNWYAKGGLFGKASVIGVGEAGNEAVLPLENRKVMKGIADSIMSGYDGSMGLSAEELAAAVERGVVTAIMNNGGIGGSAPEYIMNSIKINERELARIVTKAQENTDYRMNPSPAY